MFIGTVSKGIPEVLYEHETAFSIISCMYGEATLVLSDATSVGVCVAGTHG